MGGTSRLAAASSCAQMVALLFSEVSISILLRCSARPVLHACDDFLEGMLCAQVPICLHQGMKVVWAHVNVGTPVLRQPLKQRGAACGAAGTQMNLFSRLFRVARSYANSLGTQPT